MFEVLIDIINEKFNIFVFKITDFSILTCTLNGYATPIVLCKITKINDNKVKISEISKEDITTDDLIDFIYMPLRENYEISISSRLDEHNLLVTSSIDIRKISGGDYYISIIPEGNNYYIEKKTYA